MSLRLFFILVFCISLVAFGIYFSSLYMDSYNGDRIGVKTTWCVELKRANSTYWESLGCYHNVLTDAGRNHIKGVLGGTITSLIPVRYIAVGNGSAPTSSSTVLHGEITSCGLARAQGDFYDLGTGLWEINVTFTYTCSTAITVNTTGAFNNATSGTLFAGGTITAVTLSTSGDQLKIRHIYNVTGT